MLLYDAQTHRSLILFGFYVFANPFNVPTKLANDRFCYFWRIEKDVFTALAAR